MHPTHLNAAQQSRLPRICSFSEKKLVKIDLRYGTDLIGWAEPAPGWNCIRPDQATENHMTLHVRPLGCIVYSSVYSVQYARSKDVLFY